MSSVVIAGDTSGTITLAAPAVSGTTTITLPATSGTLLQSGTAVTAAQGGTGLTAVGSSGNLLTSNGTAWVSSAPAASGGMTLLGTVSATSGNSVSLGSLDLTSYTELHIAMKSVVSSGTAWNFVSSTNSQSAAYSTFYTDSPVDSWSGIFIFNLVTGSFIATSGKDTDSSYGGRGGGLGNITTASTTLYFRLASTYTYSGSGSFKVYGVK
jgi:hypothetical protein